MSRLSLRNGIWAAVAVSLTLGAAIGCEGAPAEALVSPPSRPAIRIAEPIDAAAEGEPGNLLQAYVKRQPIDPREASEWELPFQIKRLVVALLITTAKDRREDLQLVLTPDAMWGMPDTRRTSARPIFGDDDGEAFLAAFRASAQRFPAAAKWQTQMLPSGPQELVRGGAEPLWSFFTEGNDRLFFRSVIYRGQARIDYVGFFATPPLEPSEMPPHGNPVGMAPRLRRAPSADKPPLH